MFILTLFRCNDRICAGISCAKTNIYFQANMALRRNSLAFFRQRLSAHRKTENAFWVMAGMHPARD
jgi:hypothetical protein